MNETKRILQLLLNSDISIDEAINLIHRYSREEIEESLGDSITGAISHIAPLLADLILIVKCPDNPNANGHWRKTAYSEAANIKSCAIKVKTLRIKPANLKSHLYGSINKIWDKTIRKLETEECLKLENIDSFVKSHISIEFILKLYDQITKNPKEKKDIDVDKLINITKTHI